MISPLSKDFLADLLYLYLFYTKNPINAMTKNKKPEVSTSGPLRFS